jgi:redox-sensing transcriptional repressor
MGEKLDALDVFYPERMTQRILGMGDIVSLVEKAQENFDEEQAKELEKKMRKKEFSLEDFLGLNNSQKAVLVGVGKLGTALLSYKGFEKYGLKITAGFDVNPDIIGKEIAGTKIYHESEMASYLKKHKIKMAILAVQTGVAQKACDKLVQDGIYAILNFSPVPLKIPDGVAVQDVDIAASLAILSTKLKVILDGKDN